LLGNKRKIELLTTFNDGRTRREEERNKRIKEKQRD